MFVSLGIRLYEIFCDPSGTFFSVWTEVMVKVSLRRASMFNSDNSFTYNRIQIKYSAE